MYASYASEFAGDCQHLHLFETANGDEIEYYYRTYTQQNVLIPAVSLQYNLWSFIREAITADARQTSRNYSQAMTGVISDAAVRFVRTAHAAYNAALHGEAQYTAVFEAFTAMSEIVPGYFGPADEADRHTGRAERRSKANRARVQAAFARFDGHTFVAGDGTEVRLRLRDDAVAAAYDLPNGNRRTDHAIADLYSFANLSDNAIIATIETRITDFAPRKS